MGRGSYTAADWLKLRSSIGLTDAAAVSEIYRNTAGKDAYGSRIADRYSCDSEDSPNATPVIIGFDNTASMGFLAEALAKSGIHRTVLELYKRKPITNPHILCAAVGDCKSDRYPLQITQFEADIRIVEQLLELYLEGGGGGNGGESYNLLWYFAARHTKTDAYRKRKKKGFLFTIGDDCCHPALSGAEVSAVFGDHIAYPLSNEELLREAGEQYEIFHIHIENPRSADPEIYRRWQKCLPGRAARIKTVDIGRLPELIVSLIRLAQGETANSILKSLDQQTAENLAPLLAAIQIRPAEDRNTILF